jgi:hypothetical protein
MPRVEKTGVYRNAKGHGFRLVEGAVVSDYVAANYHLPAEDAGADDSQDSDPVEEVRDGVVSDGEGGEVAVQSAIVEARDAAPVEAVAMDSQTEIKLGGAPENRMNPAPAENRQSSNSTRKRKNSAATDAELSSDAVGDGETPAADVLGNV